MVKLHRSLKIGTQQREQVEESRSASSSCTKENGAEEPQKGTAFHSGQQLMLPRLPQHTKPKGNAFLALEPALS